ncbi:unnamed protein product [Bursaphelenchus xylophilus]|uniref:(pine wood nematode) hypothetical protein n=1 Tax=Bursaphelenchus xylophilus TaxID=6326 RepID=A0A1I7RNA9_BURXY|nr:unnamed protein product [Bursaphelenchus xylophilus]CAG9123824.1 unnamed protein product [Bursaphelenchus xylophilus]
MPEYYNYERTAAPLKGPDSGCKRMEAKTRKASFFGRRANNENECLRQPKHEAEDSTAGRTTENKPNFP